MPDSTLEIWRLHLRRVTAVCRIAHADGHVQLTVHHDDVPQTITPYATWPDAADQAESLRRQYLADGWSGVFDR